MTVFIIDTMKSDLIAALLLLPSLSSAELLSCSQQQSLCEAECQVASLGDDSNLTSCKAECLGKRASCTLDSGVDSAKELSHKATETGKDVSEKAVEAGKSAVDTAKSFWKGLSETSEP